MTFQLHNQVQQINNQHMQQAQHMVQQHIILQQPPPLARPPTVNIPPPGVHIPQHAGPLVIFCYITIIKHFYSIMLSYMSIYIVLSLI